MADLETITLSATASLSALLAVNVVTYYLNRRKERSFERARTEYGLKMTRYEKILGLLYGMQRNLRALYYTLDAPWSKEQDPVVASSLLVRNLMEAHDDAERAGITEARPVVQRWEEGMRNAPTMGEPELGAFSAKWLPEAVAVNGQLRVKLHARYLTDLRQHAPLVELVSGGAAYLGKLTELVSLLVGELDHAVARMRPGVAAPASTKDLQARLDKVDALVKQVADGMKADLEATLRR